MRTPREWATEILKEIMKLNQVQWLDVVRKIQEDAIQKPTRFTIAVLQDDGNEEHTYIVTCNTEGDAMQLAFALDGGWGTAQTHDSPENADTMLDLAQAYCRIVPNASDQLPRP